MIQKSRQLIHRKNILSNKWYSVRIDLEQTLFVKMTFATPTHWFPITGLNTEVKLRISRNSGKPSLIPSRSFHHKTKA